MWEWYRGTYGGWLTQLLASLGLHFPVTTSSGSNIIMVGAIIIAVGLGVLVFGRWSTGKLMFSGAMTLIALAIVLPVGFHIASIAP